MLTDEGYVVRRALVKGASLVLIRAVQPLKPELARKVRVSLGPRGRACVTCPASHVIACWFSLRDAGLEPKQTVLLHPAADAPATVAIVVALPAKRGGLTVHLLCPSPSG